MSATQTSRRVSMIQLHHLWEFLDNHREIAVGYNKSIQARDHSRRMWERAAEILNSTGDGATKSSSEWSKYWVDFKAKLKRKNRLIIESQRRTGGGPATNLELTEIERKFLSILGEDYGSGLPGVRVEPPLLFQDIQQDIPVPSNPDTSQSTATEDPIFLVVPSSEELQSGPNEVTTSEALQQRRQTPIREIVPTPVDPQRSPSTQGATEQGARRRLVLSVQAEPSPIIGQASSEQGRTRRRRQGQRISAADARERLVRSSEMRSQAEMKNSRSIERAVDYLSEIVSVLQNIQSGLSDAVARGASQGPPS